MPQIIYRKTAASPWIKQGDRLTKTFASGLCLIQQTYIAPKALATYSTFMEGDAITESQPCIDGAYIFPAPDYQDTGDGFMRCTVTAYGRVNTTGSFSTQKIFCTASISIYANQPTSEGYANNQKFTLKDGFADLLTHRIVTQKKDIPNINTAPSFFGFYEKSTSIDILSINLTPQSLFPILLQGTWQGDFTPRKLKFLPIIERIESVNYGSFDEYSITWKPRIYKSLNGVYDLFDLTFENNQFERDQYLPPTAPLVEIESAFSDYFKIKITPKAFTNKIFVSIKEGSSFISASTSGDRTPLSIWNQVEAPSNSFFLFGGDIMPGKNFEVIAKAENSFGSSETSINFVQQTL
jgi:hypothetical protein